MSNTTSIPDTLSCFVITGFGEKTDLVTGRILNMNVVYEKILKPVCDTFTTPRIDCFRACDKLYTGTIDSFMYKWIFDADIAIADISTLNPNAIYELGVRYALKPYSTIVISESRLEFPFDLGHVVIQKYVHGGKDIDPADVLAFSKKLKTLIQLVLDRIRTEGDDCNDSPVYEILRHEILPPRKRKKKIQAIRAAAAAEPAKAVAGVVRTVLQEMYSCAVKKTGILTATPEIEAFLSATLPPRRSQGTLSLTELMNLGEEKKNEDLLQESLTWYGAALELDPRNRFLIQRIVLLTYKLQKPDPWKALKLAEALLLDQLHPDELIDAETFGLAGAIYKRLAKWEEEAENNARSCKYYEKGYIICNDYYNGVNCAFMYLVNAAQAAVPNDRITLFGNAQKIWNNVVLICDQELARTQKDPGQNAPEHKDRIWILQSKAQAMLGLSGGVITEELEQLLAQIKQSDNRFATGTFLSQNNELIGLLNLVTNAI